MANKKNLRFELLAVSAFAGIGKETKVDVKYPEGVDITEKLNGIEKENGVVIVFPEGYNYIEFEGNQGVGKTSLIECLKEATGGLSNSNTEHISADEEGKIVVDKKYKDRFWGADGNLYNLRVTKSTITLERIETDEQGNPIKNVKGIENASIMKSPKGLLQELIGPGGISPMVLKNMNGDKQIEWIKSLFSLSPESQKFELDLKNKYDKAYKDRTAANNNYTRIVNVLSANEYYVEAEKWQKYFDTTKYETLEAEVSDVIKRKTDYDKAIAGIPDLVTTKKGLDNDVKDLEEQIKLLQAKLDAKKEEVGKLELRIAAGEKYVKDNEGVVKEFEDLADKRKEASEYKARIQ
jgi:hypothetical protein